MVITMHTTDILFCAWLDVKHNIKFKSYRKSHKGIYIFDYNVEERLWEKLKLEFYDSTTTKCRYGVKKIKDLLS